MVRRLTLLVPVAALLAGCGPSRQTERMLEDLAHGDTAKAEVTAKDLHGDDADEALVRHMDVGLIRHLAGDLPGSLAELDAAAPLVDERRSVSVGDRVGTALVNDTVAAFQGRAYEHTQVDLYRVLGHLLTAQRLEQVWNPPRLLWPAGPVPAPAAPGEAAAHRQQAVIAARRMTINQLKETEDAQQGRTYDDDPFARLLAGALISALPAEERTEADEQFATAMLQRAVQAYARQHQAMTTGNRPFRYEVAAEPTLARLLWLRQVLRYDPEEGRRLLADRNLTADQVAPAPGTGSVLILHQAGFIARPEPLQIGLGAVGFATPKDATSVSWGHVVFVVQGPGHEIASTWASLPIPGDVVQTLLAPGGAAVIGFELPAHRPDQRVPEVASVTAGPVTVPAEVVCDLDAYARATLQDEQPRLLLRTLLRVAAKQAAVAVGSAAVRRSNDQAAGLLAFLLNLAGSVAATASESADLRAWTTLPNRLEGALVDLPAGTHALRVKTTLGTWDLGQVQVRPGRLVVATLRTPDSLLLPTSEKP